MTPEELERARMFGFVPQAPAQQPGIDPQVAQQLFDPMQMSGQMGQQQHDNLRMLAEKGVIGSGGIRASELNPNYGQTKNGIDWLKKNYNPPDYSNTPTPHQTATEAVARRKQTQANRQSNQRNTQQPSIDTEMARGLFTTQAPPMPAAQRPIEPYGPPASLAPRPTTSTTPFESPGNFYPPDQGKMGAPGSRIGELAWGPDYDPNIGAVGNLKNEIVKPTSKILEQLSRFLFGPGA